MDAPCAEEFLALPDSDKFVTDDGNGKFHVDLWACNRAFLLGAGVLPEHITTAGVCTMCNSDLLFSHRVTRGKRGSNARVPDAQGTKRMSVCTLCPRKCGVDREIMRGYCQSGDKMHIAREAPLLGGAAHQRYARQWHDLFYRLLAALRVLPEQRDLRRKPTRQGFYG